MTKTVAWAVFVLGLAHIVFGIARFEAPLTEAVNEGFSGKFSSPEVRRTAFWFIACGPLYMLIGHIAIHAVAIRDLKLLKVIGVYMLAFSSVGVAAFPVSPLWAPLLLSLPLIAAGYGLLPAEALYP
jgi:Family of unknown function (DUF6463)